jgi:hypothetical protein
MNWSARSISAQSEIWLTVGGKSHHLARIFTCFPSGNQHFSLNFAVSTDMA